MIGTQDSWELVSCQVTGELAKSTGVFLSSLSPFPALCFVYIVKIPGKENKISFRIWEKVPLCDLVAIPGSSVDDSERRSGSNCLPWRPVQLTELNPLYSQGLHSSRTEQYHVCDPESTQHTQKCNDMISQKRTVFRRSAKLALRACLTVPGRCSS